MSIKFNCSNPACRGRIEVEEDMAGGHVPCPVCGTALHVPASHNIKFNCPNADCEQHIVVDVSEAGRFLRCPACGKPAQVPGDPPKSLGSGLTPKPKPAPPADEPPTPRAPLTPFKRLLAGWAIGAAVFALLWGGLQLRVQSALPKNLDRIAREIYWHGTVRGAPLEDHADNALFFLQDSGEDIEVWRVALGDFSRRRIATIEGVARNSEFKWLGWSPDWKQFAYFIKNRNAKQQQIIVCDNATGTAKSSFDTGQALEAAWLDNNSLAYVDIGKKLFLVNLAASASLGENGKAGVVDLKMKGRFKGLIHDTGFAIAYSSGNALRTVDIATGKTNELCKVAKGSLQDIRRGQSGKYLFTVYETQNGGDHYACVVDPAHGDAIKPLSATNTTAPNWILGDGGFACLAAGSNGASLVLETGDDATRTNLFAGAKLQAYSVGDFGGKIFAVANDSDQMSRLWEYDIARKVLRKIVAPGEEQALRKIVAPVFATTTNTAGGTVEYFFVPPANLDPQKKYPVVFDLRGKTQMDENAQLLANAGIYYIALKPVASAEPVYDNAGIMAVREVLLKNPNVDAQKIYLCAQDVNVPIASYALDDHPGVWRGMIIVSPKTSLTLPSSETKPPGFFVSTGAEDEERVLDRLAQFELDACRQLIPVRVDLQKKAKRAYRPEHYADCYQQIARFVALDW